MVLVLRISSRRSVICRKLSLYGATQASLLYFNTRASTHPRIWHYHWWRLFLRASLETPLHLFFVFSTQHFPLVVLRTTPLRPTAVEHEHPWDEAYMFRRVMSAVRISPRCTPILGDPSYIWHEWLGIDPRPSEQVVDNRAAACA